MTTLLDRIPQAAASARERGAQPVDVSALRPVAGCPGYLVGLDNGGEVWSFKRKLFAKRDTPRRVSPQANGGRPYVMLTVGGRKVKRSLARLVREAFPEVGGAAGER
jgi:hypothetical protein